MCGLLQGITLENNTTFDIFGTLVYLFKEFFYITYFLGPILVGVFLLWGSINRCRGWFYVCCGSPTPFSLSNCLLRHAGLLLLFLVLML